MRQMIAPSYVVNNWYSPLATIASLGSQHKGVTSLAGLHEARGEHLSQFFTPADVAAFMWRIAEPAMDKALGEDEGDLVALLDNSVGSGRLFQFADPKKHLLAGFDVHAPSVDAVGAAAIAAGFMADFIVGGLEDVRPAGFGVALINPPFSIHLESPLMEGYECCSFGKYGPRTSCLSHVYAVAQALDAADIVVAVLPLTFAETLQSDSYFSERLRYIAKLPASAFLSEGANVSTAVVVWDSLPNSAGVLIETIKDIATAKAPALDLVCKSARHSRRRSLNRGGIDIENPSILTPVTGDNEVRVVRHNRRLILKFKCGLVEAKVLNAIYERPVSPSEKHRYPAAVKFKGQGAFDLQIHLMQDDPVQSFQGLLADIRNAGGKPNVDMGIVGYLRRQAKRVARHRVPFAHTIRAEGVQLAAGGAAEITARATFLLNPKKWGGPVIKKGARLSAQRHSVGKWVFSSAGADWVMTDEEINKRFELANVTEANNSEWLEKFAGRCKASPNLAHQARKRAEALGITNWLTWDYQVEDLVELSISPYGSVTAWEMGLGKTRLAIALFIMGGSKHNLHVTEAHLVPEVVMELESLGIPKHLWCVIDSAEALDDLRLINIISYNRLRQPVERQKSSRFTYGKALRRRIGTMICDEGHCLRNLETEQTRAAWSVAARRRHVFTGTLVANYPRDTLAIMAWVAGSATVAQPYGIRGDMFLEDRFRESMSIAYRGLDKFRENFVTLEWVTNEFAEDMQGGAKREIPKIANLPLYRAMLAPLVKRRVVAEPAVAKFVRIPKPIENTIQVEWDSSHLGYYLDVADNFASWYREAKQKAGERRTNLNLIALLARIGAVETACNVPQAGIDGFGSFSGLTSKQAYGVEHVTKLANDGHKIIVYVRRPQVIAILARELLKNGVQSVSIHGGLDIDARTKDLRENFRLGPVPVLLATLGCTQTGLNIPECDRIVYLSRDWTAKTERQANARALRPQQKKTVVIDYLHHPGSIDDYQAMMSSFKADAADAGLDWASPTKENEEFTHLDTILGRFVENIGLLRGIPSYQMRESLATGVN